MDKKVHKLTKRRFEREKSGVSKRTLFNNLLIEKMKAAGVISELKNIGFARDKKRAIQNAKAGYNPFL